MPVKYRFWLQTRLTLKLFLSTALLLYWYDSIPTGFGRLVTQTMLFFFAFPALANMAAWLYWHLATKTRYLDAYDANENAMVDDEDDERYFRCEDRVNKAILFQFVTMLMAAMIRILLLRLR